MRKILLTILVAFMIFVDMPIVWAMSAISYLGDAEEFVIVPDDTLFDNFTNLMPGDKVSSQIEVKNASNKNVKIKLYMRSLGSTSDTDKFLSQLNLTVKQDSNTNMYKGPANESGSLSDWYYLGTIYSGGKVKLDVEVEVPLELSDDYQDSIGYIDWQFKVEELPVEDSDPKNPNTIDNIYVYLFIGICSLIILIVVILLIILDKKQNKIKKKIR